MEQICPKSIFPIKNRKIEHQHWIKHIQIRVGTKFQFQLIILTFWTKFAKKGYFRSKTERVNIMIEFCMFELFYVPNFSLNRQFWFFGPSLPKKGISTRKQKSEQHHRILRIRIMLGAIFLGAMALLSQSRQSWPSMAPLDQVENLQMKMLWHF